MTAAGIGHAPFSARLAAIAPLPPEIASALARFEGLPLADLQRALRHREARLRRWARDPANHGRASAESPGHLERVALGTVIEHRTLGG